MNRNCFTLIEMLVTIGIIAILASLIATAAVSMGESGKRAQAEMELSTFYKALKEYKFKYNAYPTYNTAKVNRYAPAVYYDNTDNDAIASTLVKLRLWTFDSSRVNASKEILDPWGNPYVWQEVAPSATDYDEVMMGLPIESRKGLATNDSIYIFSTGNFEPTNFTYTADRASHWVFVKGGK